MTHHIAEAPSAALPEGFLELPPLVYGDDPMWVPEDPESVVRAFNPDAPWFRDGGESAAFCIPGFARLAVFVGPSVQVDGKKVAFFGYWETTGDDDADDAIFARAEKWASERGVDALYGPINFSTYGNYRIRLTANDSRGYTFANEPYNPTRYADTLERVGFSRAKEALTQDGTAELAAAVRVMRMPKLQKVLEAGYRIEALPHELWLERIDEFRDVIHSAFCENWGYSAISPELFRQMCGEKFIRKTCPVTSTVAFDDKDNIVSITLVYPHWGPLIVQEAGENRVNVNDIDYKKHWPMLQETGKVWSVTKTNATIPAEQNKGLLTASAVSMFERAEGIYDHFYASLMGPEKFNRRYSDGLADDSRWYATYGKPIA